MCALIFEICQHGPSSSCGVSSAAATPIKQELVSRMAGDATNGLDFPQNQSPRSDLPTDPPATEPQPPPNHLAAGTTTATNDNTATTALTFHELWPDPNWPPVDGGQTPTMNSDGDGHAADDDDDELVRPPIWLMSQPGPSKPADPPAPPPEPQPQPPTTNSNQQNNQSNPLFEPEYYDTPKNRLDLTRYIIFEFREQNLTPILETSRSMLESSFRDVFDKSLASEPLFEAGQRPSSFAGGAASTSFLSGDPNGTTHQMATNGQPGGSLEAPLVANLTIPKPYYGDLFQAFQVEYWLVNCTTCLAICLVGIFTNLTNIVVLTRPNMISAVNTILCAIACADFIVNLSNIPYLMHELSDNSNMSESLTYNWALYTLCHAHVTVTAHTISIWLTCALATWRYCVIRSQSSNKRNWSVGLAIRVIVIVSLFVPLFCIPNYLSFAIQTDRTERNSTIYKVGFSRLADTSQFIKTFHFWIFSCLTKLLPCVLLTVFTTVLIRKLLSARERRLRLTSGANQFRCTSASSAGFPPSVPAKDEPKDQARKAPNGQLSKGRGDSNTSRRLELPDKIVANGLSGTNTDAANEAAAGQLQQHRQNSGQDNSEARGNSDGGWRENALVINEKVQRVALSKAPQGHVHEDDEFRHGCEADSDDQRIFLTSSRGESSQDGGAANGGHPAIPQANDSTNDHHRQTALETRNVQLACNRVAVTPRSGSSCATDAECLPASNSISDLSYPEVGLEAQHDEQLRASSQQHLLVETKAVVTSSQVVCTRMQTPVHERTALIGHSSDKPSASSQGETLDLYAINDNNGGASSLVATNHQSSALVQRNCAPQSPTLFRDNKPNRAASAIPQTNNSSFNENGLRTKRGLGGNRRDVSLDQLATSGNRGRSMGSATFAPLNIVKFQATQRQLSQNETTTRLLIAVIIVFLICEFPAGILAALCAILGQDFFENVYQPMGIVTDLLALINSAVNFILYCCMSTQFRVTFLRVVLHCPAPTPPNQLNNRLQQPRANR